MDERELTRFESTVRYVNGRERHDIVHWDPVTKVPATVELRGYNDRGGWAFIGYERGRAVTVYRRGLNEDARWVLAVPGFVARLEVPRRTGGTDVWVFDAMKKLVPR